MAPIIKPVQTDADYPKRTTVIVVGGGIIGLTTALNLAERGIPVIVLEKGRIASEQSSRNLGWIRKTSRSPANMPLALEAERLWAQLQQRTGMDVGYRQNGIMFAARTEAELNAYRRWIESVKELNIDSKLLTPEDIDQIAPGSTETWVGGVYTPSDGSAEPTLATSAIARTAQQKSAIIVENCAVRSLTLANGRVTGVVTERGEIECEHVVLATGIWSRRFLKSVKVNIPTLPLLGSVIRTGPMDGPTDIAFGASDFSFRKRLDGGYTIMQRGALSAPLTLDHLQIGMKYFPTLKANRNNIRISLGRQFLDDIRWPRISANSRTIYEKVRTYNPHTDHHLLKEAMTALVEAWPIFKNATISQTWAGLIEVTPDGEPIMSNVTKMPGLTLAVGFSGHGFGTSLSAGRLIADLVTNSKPVVDAHPYRVDRFEGNAGGR